MIRAKIFGIFIYPIIFFAGTAFARVNIYNGIAPFGLAVLISVPADNKRRFAFLFAGLGLGAVTLGRGR